ncbi:hypothetical protein DSUL_170016 [Desulfovibrionales bacterium]
MCFALHDAGIAQWARASAFQAEGCGFESRFPLHLRDDIALSAVLRAHVAQTVEHILGKDEVTGSNPVVGSSIHRLTQGRHLPALGKTMD